MNLSSKNVFEVNLMGVALEVLVNIWQVKYFLIEI